MYCPIHSIIYHKGYKLLCYPREKLINDLIKGKSFLRFGDGELNMVLNKESIHFQDYSEKLRKSLLEIIFSNKISKLRESLLESRLLVVSVRFSLFPNSFRLVFKEL